MNEHESIENNQIQSYSALIKLILQYNLNCGAEIGVAPGDFSDSILNQTRISKLYGIDCNLQRSNDADSINFGPGKSGKLSQSTFTNLASFGDRFELIRLDSIQAARQINHDLDFILLNNEHSYQGTWRDLCAWFPKIKIGGIVSGHNYALNGFSGVMQAVDEFFRRFDFEVHKEVAGVWWIQKRQLSISYFMPAYNCQKTIAESVASILEGNFRDGDELIIVNDGSTDDSAVILDNLTKKSSEIKIFNHSRNKGGGAARNTAIEHATHPLLFCLDSDNVLQSNSVPALRDFLISSGADTVAFQESRFFESDTYNISHSWSLTPGPVTINDYLSTPLVPGSGGNYLFTKESWSRAGGYPEFAGAMDTWGFGLRQVMSGSKVMVLKDTYYYHRTGQNSYWVRDAKEGKLSLEALQILIPYLDLIDERDVRYITSQKYCRNWYANIVNHPIRIRSQRPDHNRGQLINNKISEVRHNLKLNLSRLIRNNR